MGLLSSVNLGAKYGNGNLFRLTLGACPELDGKNVVFGKVLEENSLKVVKTISSLGVHSDFRPKYPVVIK
jgi:cyclophilin family peptidyl-prolyl cis-trans isomerase